MAQTNKDNKTTTPIQVTPALSEEAQILAQAMADAGRADISGSFDASSGESVTFKISFKPKASLVTEVDVNDRDGGDKSIPKSE
jgi:hypothetical protein